MGFVVIIVRNEVNETRRLYGWQKQNKVTLGNSFTGNEMAFNVTNTKSLGFSLPSNMDTKFRLLSWCIIAVLS